MLCARIITQLAAGGRRQGSVPDEQVVRVAVHLLPLVCLGWLLLVMIVLLLYVPSLAFRNGFFEWISRYIPM